MPQLKLMPMFIHIPYHHALYKVTHSAVNCFSYTVMTLVFVFAVNNTNFNLDIIIILSFLQILSEFCHHKVRLICGGSTRLF